MEIEAVAGETGENKRAQSRRSARERGDFKPGLDDCPHQLVARIGNEWRPGVRYQRHSLATFQPFDNLRPDPLRVVLVIADEGCVDPVSLRKAPGYPGVFAGDGAGGARA